MQKFIGVVIVLFLLTASGWVEKEPEEILKDAILLYQMGCTLNITKERGVCQLYEQGTKTYAVFWKNGRIHIIKVANEGIEGYETIYEYKGKAI